MVGVDKVLNPIYHGSLCKPVTRGTVWVVLDVKHPWECDAVSRPASSVCNKEVGLGCAGTGSGKGEVVATADQACSGCAIVMRRERRVDVGSAFGGLWKSSSLVAYEDIKQERTTLMMTKRAPLLYAPPKLTFA